MVGLPKPNVILIVVDTLREDHSGGLDALLDMGFVRYENAIAPAPWTLPSHVSMFTGMYPGMHGVHEGYSENPVMDEVAAAGMSRLGHGFLGELVGDGYEAYFLTANPYITPQYGFNRYTRHLTASQFLPEALDWEEFSRISSSFWRNGSNYLRTVMEFLEMGRGGLLGRALLRALSLELGLGFMEKGSGAILRAMGRLVSEARDPFFLFVNLMEAHEPYTPRDLSGSVSARATFSAVFEGRVPGDVAATWRRRYPGHAARAVARALDVVRALGRRLEGSLTIVTSDHGQLLGDGGIGHGYFLADGLLRVPLYVRWPPGVRPPRQVGRYVSLTQIRSIVSLATGGDGPGAAGIGTDVAIAESFGPPSAPRELLAKLPRGAIRAAFARRARIYTRGGSATYNVGMDLVEEARGMDASDAREIARRALEIGGPGMIPEPPGRLR
jgi:hypothetical protein